MHTKTTAHESYTTAKPAYLKIGVTAVLRRAQIRYSQLMRRYTDWKIGATRAEKYLYKTSPSIVLSFDDFGSTIQVERLLGILASEKVRGVFFLQGDWTEQNPLLASLIRKQGHFIGNHTYSHPDLLNLNDDEIRAEIMQGPDSPLMRPPMGRYDQRVRELSASLGQRIAYWTIDSDDWKGVSTAYMTAKIMRQLHPGAVILFHLHVDNTAELLSQLIPAIRQRGYDLLSFDEPFMETDHVQA